MSRGIAADAAVDRRDLAHHQAQTDRTPAAFVGELEKYVMCRYPRRHDPEDSDDGKEPEDVHEQKDILENGKSARAQGVGDEDDHDHGKDQKGPLPILR